MVPNPMNVARARHVHSLEVSELELLMSFFQDLPTWTLTTGRHGHFATGQASALLARI